MRARNGTVYSFVADGYTYVLQLVCVHESPPVPHGTLVRVPDWKREGDGPVTSHELDEAVTANTRFFTFLALWALVRDGSLSRCGHRAVPESCSEFPLLRYYEHSGPNGQRRCGGLWDGEEFYPRGAFTESDLLSRSIRMIFSWTNFVDRISSGWSPCDYPLDFPIPKK